MGQGSDPDAQGPVMGREPDRQGLSLPDRCRKGGPCCEHMRPIKPDIKDGVSTPETYTAYLFPKYAVGLRSLALRRIVRQGLGDPQQLHM